MVPQRPLNGELQSLISQKGMILPVEATLVKLPGVDDETPNRLLDTSTTPSQTVGKESEGGNYDVMEPSYFKSADHRMQRKRNPHLTTRKEPLP